ncbi:MAG: T9SS type A sorting domain-containing protein [Ignavibacterium sp.]|nr:T9SS type A sorting domain-containing protein [Ignavibacterium sp.]MCX7610216.1 T9SS type A sorting domain-containing protein [Ignavibacterium sp.]MDW8375141.1 T9SS type A sorting domain-containing protein [Ignavibacteriales bacterium]
MKKIIFYILFILSSFQSIYPQKEDILPVQLIYFEAQVLSNGVLLRWGTATEINNFGFEVQRANIPYQFSTLGFVPGHGNSNSPKHYMFVDTTLPNYGLYYYRLKQIDTDGTIHYSDTISVNYFPASVKDKNQSYTNESFVYHNPDLNKLTINLTENITDEITISIFSITGEKVEEKIFANPSNPISFSYKNLPAGVYLILINTKSKFLLSNKFIILK